VVRELQANGVVFVASSGNTTRPVMFRPASHPGAIAVAASNAHHRKADFSTPGPWLSVAAPGVKVLSAVRSQTMQPGVTPPRRLLFDYWDGTSMSGPYVAALAAMILEKHPTATPYQVKRLIESTARDIGPSGFDDGTGHGLIQADRALAAALPANDGGALRIHVVTASSMALWGEWFPVPFMDITLRKDGRVVGVGQTDYEGWANIGFPTGDYPPGFGLGYFPVLEPGTYEIVVGGDDARWFNYRTANRVTARKTVTVTAGGVTTVDIPVNTTLEVTLAWSGGDATTLLDLVMEEPHPPTWRRASSPGPFGDWTPDASGPAGTETYTLKAVHGDYAFYRLAVDYVSGARPTLVTVTVRQNTVVETYTIPLTIPGWYFAFLTPAYRWPGWWDTTGGPFVF
jgi:hypothetical protein